MLDWLNTSNILQRPAATKVRLSWLSLSYFPASKILEQRRLEIKTIFGEFTLK